MAANSKRTNREPTNENSAAAESHVEPIRLRIYRGPEAEAAMSASQDQVVDEKPIAELPVITPPSAAPQRPPLPSPEYLANLKEESDKLEQASPEEIIRWAVEKFAPKLTMATAFGPEGMCIIHMLAKIDRTVPVFNLDTGYQFQETLDLRDRVLEKYGIDIEMRKPEMSVAEYEALHGGPIYGSNPDQCCLDRKLKVLERSAIGMSAWMSGIRRDQSPDRARAPIVGWDKKFGLVKISPLANWTKKEVWGLITKEDVPYNTLHDQGYTSIGCKPCTRAVMFGEDERAGRWSGFEKKECGLHTTND